MTIRFFCPEGHRLEVDERLAGREGRCPKCGKRFRVPRRAGGKPPVRSSGASKSPPARKPPPKTPSKSPAKSEPNTPSPKGPPPLPAPRDAKPGKPEPRKPPIAPTKPSASDRAERPPRPPVRPDGHDGAKPPPVPPGETPAADRAKQPPERAAKADAAAKTPPEHAARAEDAAKRSPERAPGAEDAAKQPGEPSPAPEERLSWRERRRRRRAAGAQQAAAAGGGAAEPAAAPPSERDRSPKRPWQRPPKLMPPDVYRADPGKVQTVKWLALFLAGALLFSVAPVLRGLEWNLAAAPGWARVALLLAGMQGVFILWMLAAPDWASVWVVMLVFAVVAALYGTATAVALATPIHHPMPLDLGDVRQMASSWCGAVMLAMALGTYLCGRTAAKWRRAYELEMSVRQRARRRPGTFVP